MKKFMKLATVRLATQRSMKSAELWTVCTTKKHF